MSQEKLVSATELLAWLDRAGQKKMSTAEGIVIQMVVIPGFKNKVNEMPDASESLRQKLKELEGRGLANCAASPTASGEAIKAAANEILEAIRYNVFTARNEEWHFSATKSVSCTQVWLCHGTDNDTKLLVELDDANCPQIEGRVHDGLVERFGDDIRFEVKSSW